MTDPVAISLISAAASVAAAIIGLANNALGRRNSTHIEEAKNQIVTLEKNTNSIKDALVKVTGEEAFARGVKSVSGPPEIQP